MHDRNRTIAQLFCLTDAFAPPATSRRWASFLRKPAKFSPSPIAPLELTWSYDRQGNRWTQAVAAGTGLAASASFTGGNNRMDATSYDAAGNLLGDGTHTYTWDGEDRLVAVDGGATARYVYDAAGRRVRRTANGTTVDDLLGPDGRVRSEYDESRQAWTRTEIAAGGLALGSYNPQTGATALAIADELGTVRARTDLAGNVQERYTSLPFGDLLTTWNDNWQPTSPEVGAISPLHFTGQPRDEETGLDDFGARYYASTMGRMLSPDPVFISLDQIYDPQALNLYAYTRNNPLTITDPTGLDFYLACQTSDHSGCGQVQNGAYKVWVQGQGTGKDFQATDVDMNKQGDPSAGYHDQFGNQYSGTFDQNNGVSFTNTATGATSGGSVFIDGSNRTQLSGSGAFAGITGNFFDACGGSCQGRAALSGSADAFAATESQFNKQGGLLTFLDRFSGAHQPGAQWKDNDGYVHMLQDPNGRMEMHFEGHATGVDLTQFVLHMVNTIRDGVSGRAAAERNTPLP